MSDNTTQPDVDRNEAAKQNGVNPVSANTPEPKMFDEAYVKELRDEAAKYRVRLKELEDRDKSEAQKQAEQLAELQKQVSEYKLRDQIAEWSQEIVKDSPIPADALRGSTREELEAHFEQLKSLVKPTDEPAPKKGAWAPFDPDEGKSPSGSMTTNADRFAEFLENKLS